MLGKRMMLRQSAVCALGYPVYDAGVLSWKAVPFNSDGGRNAVNRGRHVFKSWKKPTPYKRREIEKKL